MAQANLTNRFGGGEIQFTSFNCKGLNNPIKRSKVLHHVQQLGARIIFLQETHLKVSDHLKLKKSWVGQIYHSSFAGKSRGTAILLHKSVPFQLSNVTSDPNGRFIIITGQIHDTRVALVNVYAPNYDDDAFFRRLFAILPDMSSHHLILGGDFNCWLCPHLDRSSTKVCAPSKSSKVIQSFMSEFAVTDAWRFLNPAKREYSFFSSVHHSFTRIDLFLVDNRLLSSVSACRYDAIVLSDHAPISMKVFFKDFTAMRAPWRLNTHLLTNEGFVDFVSKQIDYFLSFNKTPDVSASLLWDSLKAYIRGEIISYSRFEEKCRRNKLADLSQRIAQIDAIYADSPSSELYKERLTLQSEYNVLTTNHTTELLMQTRSSFFEQGDKAGKLLAHQLRQRSTSNLIPQIRSDSGITTIPCEINNTFKKFYSTLYSSDQVSDSAFDAFFNNLDIPSIEQPVVEELEKPITLEELNGAASNLQSGKCPGPDGFPSDFYKKFFHKLGPILLDMFNEAFELGCLPQTLTQASISLLLKKGKDPLDCTSYRPISLLNADFKLLSKLLASRLESYLPFIISPEQTGFIRGRQSFSNLRQLFSTIYNPSPFPSTHEALISLDAEKAFDRVEWNYLFYTLGRFGFGEKFISWVRLLYASPLASVRTNNVQSEYFRLYRSTRQGCPLSPLLFAIAMEPLSVALRTNPRITGISRHGVELKVSLYADDLLLYVSNLPVSVPAALDTLDSFGRISGYKLNLSKSEIFPVNEAARKYPLRNLPFKVAMEGFTYLGIYVARKYEDLNKTNFAPLMKKLKGDFERWSILRLSLAARINTVKMNILPRFTYLFQCIPLFLPQTFFRRLDSMISEFIWDKKVPRIRKQYLQRPKSLGGMALPNFRFYYWSANIRILKYWLLLEDLDPPPTWLVMEANSARPVTLVALAHSPINSSTAPYTKNIIVKNSHRIWIQFRRHFGLQPFSIHAPLASNHVFHPSLIDSAFSTWSNHGIHSFNDLYFDNVFASFQQLSDKYTIPKQHFFRYLQVRSFIQKTFPTFPNSPNDSAIDTFLQPLTTFKGAISIIYNQICDLRPESLQALKARWEGDIGEELTEEVWNEMLVRVHRSSICARHALIQCKLLHRIYYTKDKLSKMHDTVSPDCNRCGQTPANLIHTFWLCPSLHSYWTEIFHSLSNIVGQRVEPTPLGALFGVFPSLPSLSRSEKDVLAFVTLLARRLILTNWKTPSPPSYTHWIRDVLYNLKLEKIRFSLNGSRDKFRKAWGPFFTFIQSLNPSLVVDR